MGIEAGSFYEDATPREQNVVERQQERDAIDERLERADIMQETQWGVESLQVDFERQEQVISILERFEWLAEEKWLSWVDVFWEFILTADNTIKELFLDRTNNRKIKNTVEASWRFPVNEFEFQQAIIEWSVLSSIDEIEQASINEEESVANEEESVANEEESESIDNESEQLLENLQHFKDSISGLNISDMHLRNLLRQLPQSINTENRDEVNRLWVDIASLLRSNNLIEQQILPQAQARGPQAYAQVRESLILLDSSFEARIMRFEMAPDFPELPAEQMVRVSGALGTRVDEVGEDAEQSGNIFTLTQTDGTQIDYDVVSNERSLTVDWYSLESQVDDNADYQTPKLEYMRVEQEHLPKLQKISAAGSALESEQLENDNIDGIKDVLKTALGYSYYLELGIDVLETAQDIQSAISEAYREHNEPLQEARDEYRDTLLGLRDAHFAALEKKDKKVKQVLRLFESIGFSMIPQYITDQIVDTLNSSASLRAQVWMNEVIDFSDGKLGFDTVMGEWDVIDLGDKKAFAEFVNKLLWVTDEQWNPPINISAIGTSSPLTWSETQQWDGRFRNLLAKSGLLVGWAWRAIRNLTANI